MVCCMLLFFFFFKQKTAYEMRISDWSSDVCSSDLVHVAAAGGERLPAGAIKARAQPELHRRREQPLLPARQHPVRADEAAEHGNDERQRQHHRQRHRPPVELGKASCRESMCRYWEISAGAVSLQKKKKKKTI